LDKKTACAGRQCVRRMESGCVERAMRIHWTQLLGRLLGRSELSATVTVADVLMAGALTKLGFVRWGLAVVAALCLAGSVIERLGSVQTTQVPSRA
jgi:hypothetical protein